MNIDSDLSIAQRKIITFLNVFQTANGTTIGQNDACNEINGSKDTNSQGVNSQYGHLRLSSGWGAGKTSIDLYGFGDDSSNRIIQTIQNIEVTEISRFYYDINIPTRTKEIAPQISGSYSLGSTNFKWADVWAVNGTIQTSDRNLKKNIKPITGGLQTILSLQPVSYQFIDGKRIHTGFIAQDSKNLFCENWAAYVEDENGCGLRYTEFISLNTQAIQELNALMNNHVKNLLDTVKQQSHKIEELERKQLDNMQRILRLEMALTKLSFIN